ncbi:hypothetical protein E4T39_00393 [Aureobasidium subglaciale]|nr:hypothetical protein E4T39_00393 [Aureobasidium subglaciale]
MFPVQNHTAGLLRKGQGQGHQRNASESTVNSTGPSSPFMQTSNFPFIANADQSPTTSYFGDNDQTFNNVGYAPSKLSHTPAAHLAMQNMAIDQHNSTYNEDIPDFAHSSRHSVSSKGQNSPSTPQPRSSSDHEDTEERPPLFKMPTNGEEVPDLELFERYLFMSSYPDYKANAPRVELNRTESAAFADELFNPNNPDTLQPPTVHTNNNMLSPHRNLIDERLRTANSIRSQSPVGDMSRERSPFRQNSPFAAPTTQNFKGPGPFLATAADSRRQQREEASAREWMSHQPKLRREPTKTMSPKDALLDFTDTDGSDMPLFADSLPSGYNFATNMAAPPTNVAGFRASSSDQSSIGSTTFNFLPPQQPTMPGNPYAPAHYRSTDFNPDSPPDFPAHLATMESSMSEGPGASSQGSMTTASISRPLHTTADTGSYTCPADGCYHRFDSAATLLKHRRDAHPARQSLSSTGTAASSPEEDRRSSSPVAALGTLGSSMTAAALAERNSQQGPHKCTRTNPSTGKPCNSIFSRPYDLTRHEDTIHNRQKQKVRCQYCREEKTFSRADALTRHMRVVHPEVDFHGKRGRKGDHF